MSIELLLAWAVLLATGPGAARGAANRTATGEQLDVAAVHALVVGVLKWEQPGFASFSAKDRQDRKFAETLIARGVPAAQVTLLLDEEATLARIETELAKVAEGAGPGSTLLVYYAGHGTRSGGKGCFANYDMHGFEDGLTMDRIGATVADHFAGTRFLAFADCCHSGSLASVVERLAKAGIEGACVTSVVPESTSTGNWTFTQTLIESFAGDASLDRDGDGFIELGEMNEAVGDAMSWREGQRSGAELKDVAGSLRIVPVVASADAARERAAVDANSTSAPAFALGEHVTAKKDGEPRVGRIVGLREDGRFAVRFYDYATHADEPIDAGDLSKLVAEDGVRAGLAVDAIVGVRRARDVMAARVRRIDRALCLVDFPDWPELPAEWVARSATAAAPLRPEGWRPCMVEWKGTWYPAAVLTSEPTRQRIHYVGFGANWDEWVDADRIRFGDGAATGAGGRPR